MSEEQEEYFKLIIGVIDWFNSPEKLEFIDEDIIKKCKESRLSEGKDFIFGGKNK
jgi:FAD synthase